MTTAQFLDALTKLAWPLLAFVVFLVFHKELRSVLRTLVARLRDGSPFRLAGFEVGSVTVVAPGSQAYVTKLALEGGATVMKDDGPRDDERQGIYSRSRNLQLVHRLLPPATDKYLFDLLIYIIPHKEGSTLAVKSVDYYFGPFWGKQVFRVETRYNAFAIQTSAYGTFLCTAVINFDDGSASRLSRYIDFEMGKLVPTKAPQLKAE